MEFSGTFELEDATIEEVWLALSDPELVWHAMPGCQFLVEVDEENPDFDALREEHGDREPEPTLDREVVEAREFEEGATYAGLLEVSVGSVSPSFRTVGAVEEREPYRMVAAGEGSSGNSSFEGSARMELTETDDGVTVEWGATADVFGRLAQMGGRVINPTANRVVKRFFDTIQETLADLSEEKRAAEAAGDGSGGDETAADESTADEPATEEPAADAESGGGLLARLKRLLGLGT